MCVCLYIYLSISVCVGETDDDEEDKILVAINRFGRFKRWIVSMIVVSFSYYKYLKKPMIIGNF